MSYQTGDDTVREMLTDTRQRDGERADREPVIVTVVIVRHPDSENAVEYYAPDGIEVRFVTADLGSSFDGGPKDEDEAEVAVEIADSLEEGVKDLPDGPAKALATSWADTLRDEASAYLPEDEDEEYDDGKTLVAGVLYDNETGEEADPQ